MCEGRVAGMTIQTTGEEGATLRESGQALEPQWFWERHGWYQLATQGRQTQRLCPLRDTLCRHLPGQCEIPKLMLRTPEPFGSS